MISSSNTFSGLSASDISQLFAANAPSGSSSTSASSTATDLSQVMSAGVFESSASDTSKAIQSILAQAQIKQAQPATLRGQSSISMTVQAAYADQAGSSSSSASANITLTSSDATRNFEAQLDPDGSSLVVGTATDVVGVTQGNSADTATGMEIDAMEGYQASLEELDQAEKASASGRGDGFTIGPNYLMVTIHVDQDSATDGAIASKVLKLIDSFKSNTLSSALPNATGFDYEEAVDGFGFSVTGQVINKSALFGGVDPVSKEILASNPYFADVIKESTAMSGGEGGHTAMALFIPLGSS